jgi:hypothetical protein
MLLRKNRPAILPNAKGTVVVDEIMFPDSSTRQPLLDATAAVLVLGQGYTAAAQTLFDIRGAPWSSTGRGDPDG